MPRVSPTEPDAENAGRSRGWSKNALIVTLIVLAILGVATHTGYRQMRKAVLNGAAPGLRSAAGRAMVTYKFQQKDAIVIQRDVNEFATRVQNSQLGMTEAARIMLAVIEDPSFMELMMQAFIVKYVEPSALSPEEKARARQTAWRFSKTGGIKTLLGTDGKPDPLAAILLQNPEEFNRAFLSPNLMSLRNIPRFKPTLSARELNDALTLMKQRADNDGVPSFVDPPDLGTDFQSAYEKANKAK